MTRRRALAACLASGSGALAAGVAAGGVEQAFADKKSERVTSLLSSALTLELSSAEAYATLRETGLVGGRVANVMVRLRHHDRRHAHALEAALGQLGAQTPPTPSSAQIPGLAAVADKASALDFAIALEEQTVATYLALVRLISHRSLIRTVAAIMSSDGQQLVVLRELAGRPEVPTAFERGSAASPSP